jgi:hypothetical protein
VLEVVLDIPEKSLPVEIRVVYRHIQNVAGRDPGRQKMGNSLVDEGGFADTAGTLQKEDLPLGGKVLCDVVIV